MATDPDLDAARLRWATTAVDQLSAVTRTVRPMTRAFEEIVEGVADSAREQPLSAMAEGVLASCLLLVGWLDGSTAPRGLGKAEAELRAVAGVYRNAAVAYKSLGALDDDARPTRVAACAAMLEQGGHHVDAFLATLARKVSIDPSAPSRG